MASPKKFTQPWKKNWGINKMARQFVGATAVIPGTYIAGSTTWGVSKKYYIDKASTTSTNRGGWTAKYSVTGGATANSAANIFAELDKISKGGPGGTKLTTIELVIAYPGQRADYSPGTRGNAERFRTTNRSIVRFFIDWEAKKIKWSGGIKANQPTRTRNDDGRSGAYWVVDGAADIPASKGLVSIKASIAPETHMRPSANTGLQAQIGLDPTTRKIYALPVFPSPAVFEPSNPTSMGDTFIQFNYQIETDDYQNITAAPEPEPEPDDPEEATGTKISQLTPAATPLKDSDLLVVSQGGEDGTYDSSNNITYAKLKEEVGGGGGTPAKMWSSGWVNTDGNTAVANQATLSFAHNLGTTDVVFNVYWSPNADGTDNMLLSNAEIGASGTSTLSLQIKSLTATNVTIQLSNLGMIQVDNNGTRTGEVSFDGGFIKVIAMGKTAFTPSGSYVEGYATTIGGTLVADGALLTVTHNLGTADVIVQVYIADDANGANNVMLNNQTDGGGAFLYDYQAQTAATNSIKVQLSASGWTKNDGSATAQHINYTAKFIKVVVLSA